MSDAVRHSVPPEESGLAGVDVQGDINVVGQVPVMTVVNTHPGEKIRVASLVSSATWDH